MASRFGFASLIPLGLEVVSVNGGEDTLVDFSDFLYRYRDLVERFFNKLKHFRGIATRYDKRADSHLAGLKLASARI